MIFDEESASDVHNCAATSKWSVFQNVMKNIFFDRWYTQAHFLLQPANRDKKRIEGVSEAA